MIEILWHGRGGQGAFTAARLLGAAAAGTCERYALAFPSFGPERRGAPMRAFTKISSHPIGDRSEVGKADFAVYLDDTLLSDDWAEELKPHGIALVNSPCGASNARMLAVDASAISREILGRDIPNTVFVALLCLLVDGVDAADAKRAVCECMPARLHEANIAVVDEVARRAAEGSLASSGPGKLPHALSSQEARGASARRHAKSASPSRLIPALHADELDPCVYARSTCWQAGYLVSKNDGWRTRRPVVDHEACTGCWMCYMLCPDGTVFKTSQRTAAIDYDFCKGCGICAKACPIDAIDMVLEGGDLR